MPINLPSRLNRRPPETPEAPELSRHIRLADETTQRSLEALADAIPESRYDELSFKSGGDGEEVRIANKLGYVPNRRTIVCAKYPYVVGDSRDGLADERFIYLKTNAPKGTRFTVRFGRIEDK